MKKLLKSLVLFAAAAMALTSCENEAMNEGIEANDTYTMNFVAGAPESKTSVSVVDNKATFSWAEKDEPFYFVQNTSEGLKKGTNVSFKNNDGVAEITATFTEKNSPIVAVYPEAAWVVANDNTNYNKIKLIVPSDQTILNDTFDPDADLLVSKEVTPENVTDTHLLQFTRLVAVGKMTIKNLPVEGTEVIEKVKFSIDSENIDSKIALSGRLYIDLATAEVSEWGYFGQANNYVNLVDGNVTAAAENEFIFTCMPATVAAGKTFTVEVTTDKATYTHSVTIPEDKSIKFTSGRVSAFGVNMATAERTLNTAIALPWTESFDSEDLSKYDITNGGGTTKVYANDNLALGAAKGEILIGKNGGSMGATFASDGTAKTLYFWFKSNKDFIEVSSATENVTINKVNSKYYTITLAEGVKQFKLTLTNNNDGNARVDDIVLTTEAPAIESITAEGAKTSFTVGNEFSYEGLTVTAVYSNGATEDVTTSATVNSSAVNMTTAGTYTVKVTYEGKETSYTITVKEEQQGGDTLTETTYKVTNFNTELGFGGSTGNVTEGTAYSLGSDLTLTGYKGGASNAPGVNKDGDFRLYQHNYCVIASPKTIIKIVFTFTSNSYTSITEATPGTYSTSTYTWTGSANSITFKNANATNVQARIKTMEITYLSGNSGGATPEPTTPVDQTVTFTAKPTEVTVGETVTVTATANTTVTYTSSDTSIATVNETTGVVTGKAAGSVTITATAAATAEYNSATATHTITVKAAEQGGGQEKTITLSGTFTSANSQLSLTQNGITVTQSKGSGNAVNSSYNTPSTLRVYWKNTLSFSGKTITRIEITYKSTKYGSKITVNNGTLTTSTQSGGTHIWTGESDNVIFTNGSASDNNVQLQTSAIKITYKD